jgi:uncharacterized Tic20 family protein
METMDRPTPSESERTWAMLAHLSAPIGIVLSAGSLPFLGPLVVWLVKRNDSPFVVGQAKEALNFHLTLFLLALGAVAVGLLLLVVTLGLAILVVVPMLGIGYVVLLAVAIVLGIVGGIEAHRGVPYRYPFALRLIP